MALRDDASARASSMYKRQWEEPESFGKRRLLILSTSCLKSQLPVPHHLMLSEGI